MAVRDVSEYIRLLNLTESAKDREGDRDERLSAIISLSLSLL